MQLGLIGLGRMGGNMRERLRARRSRGRRLRPQPGASPTSPPWPSWSSKLDGAARGVGDGPGRRSPRPTIAELADLLDKGDLVIDGGNSRSPTTARGERLASARASATSTAASPAASGAWTTATA